MLSNDKVSSIPKTSEIEITSEIKFLGSFSRNSSNFLIDVNKKIFKSRGYQYEKLWLVLRDIKGSNGYALNEGDIIRLGKVQLKVKEIKGLRKSKVAKFSVQSKNIYSGGLGGVLKEVQESQSPLEVKTLEIQTEVFPCRICLGEEFTTENPLITPCNCAGSMGWIHLECLQKWLGSKVASRDHNNSTSYSWKSLECELCKFKYPDKIQIQDNVYDLLFVKKPDNNFIVLESVNNGNSENRIINIISFQDKKNIRLGRGHDSDIRLADISVSRNHANIKITNNGLFLDDVSSKFGTLIKIKKPIVMSPGTKISVQSGRTLMEISVKKPFSLFGCFGSCKNKKNSDDEEPVRVARDITEESISQSDPSASVIHK